MPKTGAKPGAHAAVCVGINRFQHYDQLTLNGCVNDANEMAGILTRDVGFAGPDRDITVLTDQRATKVSILDRLAALVDQAKAGKLEHIVFSFSSHGTQVPDEEGDEPDRLDEAFCPHDLVQLGGSWNPDHIITDDELRDLFVQLPSEVLLEVFLDTCHSGTGLRAIDLLLDRQPRFVPPPSVDALRIAERSVASPRLAMLSRDAQQILWAACRSFETSADALIDGDWHGAFTYFYCKTVAAAKNALPRRALLKRVREALQAAGFPQVPQLETHATTRHVALHSTPGTLIQVAGRPEPVQPEPIH